MVQAATEEAEVGVGAGVVSRDEAHGVAGDSATGGASASGIRKTPA